MSQMFCLAVRRDISCVGGGEPELEKLARGKFVESRQFRLDHEVTMYTIALGQSMSNFF
jgi:hypothetical protein